MINRPLVVALISLFSSSVLASDLFIHSLEQQHKLHNLLIQPRADHFNSTANWHNEKDCDRISSRPFSGSGIPTHIKTDCYETHYPNDKLRTYTKSGSDGSVGFGFSYDFE